MEIFSTGELEQSMDDMKHMSWSELLKSQYNDLIDQLLQPPRNIYTIEALGAPNVVLGTKSYQRNDFWLKTSQSLRLHCSHWIPSSPSGSKIPCLVYLHGITESQGGNKLGALDCLRVAIKNGMSLFAYDSRGNGLSEGQDITYGYEEKHDLKDVIRYLKGTLKISHIFLWGNGIGAATALQYVDMIETEANAARSTFTIDLKEKDLGVEWTTRGHLRKHVMIKQLCSTSAASTAQVNGLQVGDTIIAIAGKEIHGPTVDKVVDLLSKARRPTSVTFRTKHSRQGDVLRVEALILDSPYHSLKNITQDLVASAKTDGLNIPSAVVSVAWEKMKHDLKKRLHFDVDKVRVDEAAKNVFVPALFILAKQNQYICPKSTQTVFDEYEGQKQLEGFGGSYLDKRPDTVHYSIYAFLQTRLKQLGEPAKIESKSEFSQDTMQLNKLV